MNFGVAIVGLGVAIGALAIGAAYGIGRLATSAVESIARQPEAAASIRGTAIIQAALIEGFTFFALIVAIILGYFASQTHEARQGSIPAAVSKPAEH